MSQVTTITITDDDAITVVIDESSPIQVQVSETGLQGPRGYSPIWIGDTPPDPAVYPLWLDTAS